MAEKQRNSPIAIAPAAGGDIKDVLRWSKKNFGPDAAMRYATLLTQAVRDLAADPHRPGVLQRPELPPDIYLYHLASSRDRTTGERVGKPRHFTAFTSRTGHIEIVRLLHDSRDLEHHLA